PHHLPAARLLGRARRLPPDGRPGAPDRGLRRNLRPLPRQGGGRLLVPRQRGRAGDRGPLRGRAEPLGMGPLARAARARGGDGPRPDGVPHLHRRRRRPGRRDLLPARGAGQLSRPRPLGLRAPDADRGGGSLPLRLPPRRDPAPTTAPLRGIAGMSTNIGSRAASTARPPRGTAGAAGRVSAVVLAAGSGSRFTGRFGPNQFGSLMGKPILAYVLDTYHIPDRANLYSGQSPQAFRYDLLVQAHQKAGADGITDANDDAQLVLRIGGQVGVVEGSYANFKITTYQDFLFATSVVERERPNDGEGW